MPATNPHHHTRNIKRMLNDIITHLREGVTKVNELKAQALFETTAEVLNGLVTAYYYEQHSEQAWK